MDNTPTALFDSYEADFKGLMESVKERLEGAGTGGTWSGRGRWCRAPRFSTVIHNIQVHFLIVIRHRATQGCYAENREGVGRS